MTVSRTAGISELGRIVQTASNQASLPTINRSVVVGSSLLTVSDSGVASNAPHVAREPRLGGIPVAADAGPGAAARRADRLRRRRSRQALAPHARTIPACRSKVNGIASETRCPRVTGASSPSPPSSACSLRRARLVAFVLHPAAVECGLRRRDRRLDNGRRGDAELRRGREGVLPRPVEARKRSRAVPAPRLPDAPPASSG